MFNTKTKKTNRILPTSLNSRKSLVPDHAIPPNRNALDTPFIVRSVATAGVTFLLVTFPDILTPGPPARTAVKSPSVQPSLAVKAGPFPDLRAGGRSQISLGSGRRSNPT